ncbi:MAG: endonuclease III, partial [Prevotella sp.]|nr:endonuclease III [Prevotella sp.]
MKREERYTIILDHFRKEMPNVTTELDFDSEFHLLVAV